MRLTLTFCLLVSLDIVSGLFSVPTVIDEGNAGHLGFAGNYAGISYVNSLQQFQSTNEDSIILRNNNNTYEKISHFQGNITSSCMFQNSIYFGGHFETVNQTYLVHHVVKFDTQTNQFQSLDQGLNGPVYSLYCDDLDQVLYIGGNFSSPVDTNSTMSNVASWNIKNSSWSLLPWKGFNGPVYTITKNKKYNTILFGGHFDATGDGQFFNSNTSQLVPLNSPTSISSGNGAYQADPKSIICPAQISNAQPWYLQDGVPGYWDANFANPVEPTVFRLSNTHTEKGTISFNILALGWNHYFNLSYVDPVTQQTIVCSKDCTLSNDTYQDFTVVDPITATGIRININSWYGSGGGLGYVQIYQSDISVNPHLNTNDSQCNPTASSTQTTVTGNWKDVYVFGYYQTILVANVPYSELATSNTAIVYEPNIPAQGQYDVYATTPGCVGSSNCFTRTQVEYSLELSPGFPVTTIISDQNTFTDHRILLYSGYISPVSTNFRPSITLRPAPNATKPSNNDANVQIMADTIEFVRNMTAAPLVSILEYNPANATNTTAISWKPLNRSIVYSIDASDGDLLYIGGEFASSNTTGFRNIVSYNNQLGQLLALDNSSAGLNGKVSKLLLSNTILYVGGDFNATMTNLNLKHVGQFDTAKKLWSPLGDGVDGSVNNLLLSSDNTTLTVSGPFNHRLSINNTKMSVGNAQWNTKLLSWTERSSLVVGEVAIDYQNILAGAILGAQTYRADLVLSSSLNSSRHIFNDSVTVSAGVTWLNNQTYEEHTVIAQYTEEMNETSTVLSYSNVTNAWTTIDVFQGRVYSLATFGTWLYVGGQFSSEATQSISLAIYDLVSNNTNIRIHGVTGTVNVIKPHPDGKKVLIGGKFSKVGLLDCEAVCAIDPSTLQWDPIALSLTGTAYDMIIPINEEPQKIIVVGDLRIQNQPATAIASVTDAADNWSTVLSSDQLSGIPNTIISSVDNEVIVAGTSLSNSFFVGSLNGNTYTSLASNLAQGTIISQLLLVPISSSSEQRYPSGTQNMLLAVGTLNIQDFGNASAALYDGTAWYPYLLTTQLNGKAGNIQKVIHPTGFNGITNGRRKY
ncbi:cortical protein marker for cell polarity-domain-containing protein [Mucor mucedo]|uniref:cortical protein marker for cell polarity-domain-containing protein n=1 Tax=Mucor mucedo TaxID=29922 RepID=UPI00221F89FB|nr:cortical protein marker for cell polarity-domain-containing protein [Mucor mucedo]KAI7880797.1 cortical protein marker for cell polarity-domain-containing protein [Mucor mucedo]